MLYTEKEFQAMLKMDEELYVNLLQMDKHLQSIEEGWRQGIPITDENFNLLQQLTADYNRLKSKYEARQHEYRTNKTYSFSQKTNEWVQEYTSDMLKFLAFGFAGTPINWLNGVQLAVPVAWVVGTALAAGVITYFCTKYFTETEIDYNEGLNAVTELAKINPELADKMLVGLNKVKQDEIKTSSTKQLLTIGVLVGIGYLAYKNRDKIKDTIANITN